MSAELTIDDHPSTTCVVCLAYLDGRMETLPEAVVDTARRRDMKPSDLFREFMHGVHNRHRSGLTLAVA